VVDRTGLTEEFDLQLEYSPEAAVALPDDPSGAPSRLDAGPSLFTAIQEQLGLKLEATRAPATVLVIDSVELPTPD
jgi:uncharacterized protein (TIGR03435 family)